MVARVLVLRLLEQILTRCHELLVVVRAASIREQFISLPAVSDDDLRRVLVRHDHSRAGQPAPVGQRMVAFQRLVQHACVVVVPDFVNVAELIRAEILTKKTM